MSGSPVRLVDLSGRRVVLWGFGREGRASLQALKSLETPPAEVVIATDSPPTAEERAGVESHAWLDGGAALGALLSADVVIRSPGISRYRDDAQTVAARTTVTTATNLWFAEHADEPMIAITGSKGKTTTSALAAHIARAAGREVVLAGNIGVPLIGHLHPPSPPDLWVVELSSHQTSDLTMSPLVGVLLNLYREHIDWHGSLERYFQDKLNLFGHRDDGFAVLNAGDEATQQRAGSLKRIIWFGDAAGYHTDGRHILRAHEIVFDGSALQVRGRHNLLNLCAALTACELLGIDARAHLDALAGFRPIRHRLEPVGEVDGVLYINDSIATIPEAVIAALDTVSDRPTILLAGGFDRGQDFSPLVRRLPAATNIAAVIVMPQSGVRLAEALEAVPGAPVVVHADDLADAVVRARALAEPGSVVLLSPAAPSYGLFRDFEERGDAFRRLVAGLQVQTRGGRSGPGPGSTSAGA